jgi:hypothetical protein
MSRRERWVRQKLSEPINPELVRAQVSLLRRNQNREGILQLLLCFTTVPFVLTTSAVINNLIHGQTLANRTKPGPSFQV